MILYCAADLLWASKIKGTADALGLPCRPVRNLDMLGARLGDSAVRALIVDLESEHGLDLIGHLRGGLGAAGPGAAVRILAFGPHVMVEKLRQAKELGADTVMARGGFSARLPQILRELASDAPALADDLHE